MSGLWHKGEKLLGSTGVGVRSRGDLIAEHMDFLNTQSCVEVFSAEVKAMAVTSEVAEDGATLIISISGRFDFSSHQDFRKAYESVSRPDMGYVIDMAGAEYLDSSALGMLLLMREHAGGDQADIRISNCRPQIKNILKVANFAKLFTVE